jgi:hypothetical protein
MDEQASPPDRPELRSLRLRLALPPPGQTVVLVPANAQVGPGLGPGVLAALNGRRSSQ